MTVSAQQKQETLDAILRSFEHVAVACSGGVDSTYLIARAHAVLGDRVLAVTSRSVVFPKRELEETVRFCAERGIRHCVLDFDVFSVDGFADNPPDRCYLCKRALLTGIADAAAARGVHIVAEGSNLDDEGDYRPGLRAIREMGIRSPLREAGLTKEEIRELSRDMQLPGWNKPSFACLASRFAYGEHITAARLMMAEEAEELLRELGFTQFRVRIHEGAAGGTRAAAHRGAEGSSGSAADRDFALARVEVLPEEMDMLFSLRGRVTEELRRIGFHYVTMDLIGYRTGSMNEVLTLPEETQ